MRLRTEGARGWTPTSRNSAWWVRLPYSNWVRRISDFLRDVCEPYLRLFRRILPALGPLDLSPVVAIFVLFLIKAVIDKLFGRFD